MRILRVIPSMDPSTGGPCQGVRNLIPAMRALGCESEVVCLDDPKAAFLGKDSFVIHALGLGKGPLFYHPSLLQWLEANLSFYDAIIVHGLWLWPSSALRIAIQRLRRKALRLSASSSNSQAPAHKIPPYFVMPHGMLDPWFQKAPGRRWKAVRNTLYWRLAEHRVIRDAEAILFTCYREMELAKSTFQSYVPKREINVGYGVPAPPFSTESMQESLCSSIPELPHLHPYLLFLGRIHPKKGLDLLIRAYAKVYGSEMNHSAPIPHLVVAGPLDSDYGKQMIHLAESVLSGNVFFPEHSSNSMVFDHQSSRNAPAIHFTGLLQGESKWAAMHGCEVFVLSSHQENFAIAVAEALSCAKPVLISDQVNIAPEIEADTAGLVGSDDQDGINLLLGRWKKLQTFERDSLAQSAYNCFVDRFGVASSAERLLDALQTGIPNVSRS